MDHNKLEELKSLIGCVKQQLDNKNFAAAASCSELLYRMVVVENQLAIASGSNPAPVFKKEEVVEMYRKSLEAVNDSRTPVIAKAVAEGSSAICKLILELHGVEVKVVVS